MTFTYRSVLRGKRGVRRIFGSDAPATERRGASTVELAVTMAIVLSAICVLVSSFHMSDIYQRVSNGLAAGDSPLATSQTPHGSMDSSERLPAQSAPPAQPPSHRHRGLSLLILAVVTLTAAIVFVRPRRGRVTEEAPATDAPPEVVPTNRVHGKRQRIFRMLSEDLQFLNKESLQVRHLMSRQVTTVSPSDSVDAIREQMLEQKIRHIIVRNRKNVVLGVISDRDWNKDNIKTVRDLMTPDPLTVEGELPIQRALTMLIDRRISCLPVVEDGSLCGILTTTDLIVTMQCILQAFQKLETVSDTE